MKTTLAEHHRRIPAWVWLNGLIVAIVVWGAAASALRQSDARFTAQYATLMASDVAIVELGDGGQALPIVADEVVPVGRPAQLAGLRVTVLAAEDGHTETADAAAAIGWAWWRVSYRVENTSDQNARPHPMVDAQIQYLARDRLAWEGDDRGECAPSLAQDLPWLHPGEAYLCWALYPVPQDSRAIYWVYEASGHDVYAVFRVR